MKHILNIFAALIVALISTMPSTADCAYDVRHYGARGDGRKLDSPAIQRAIDRCSHRGGGVVTLPPGTYLAGTLQLRNGVTLHLDKGATLLGTTDLDAYSNPDPFVDGLGTTVGAALIVAVDAHDVGITGQGVIDGQGSALKERQARLDNSPEGRRWGRRPFLLRMVKCRQVRVEGITLQHSAAWTSHYFQCTDVVISNVTIRSLGLPHNDGIDIDGCQRVRVSGCDVISGDDALCLKTTSSTMACSDIEVTDMRLKSNQAGIKFGTESMAPFERISISRCHIYDTRNGGIKLLSVDGAALRQVLITDITMHEVRTPMLFRLGARLSVFRKAQDRQQTVGLFDQVVIRNVEAVASDVAQLTPPSAILVTGIPGHRIKGLTLENIHVTLLGTGTTDDARVQVPESVDKYPEIKTFGPKIPAYGVWARHVDGLLLRNVTFTLKHPDARPKIICEDGSIEVFD